MTEAFGSGRWKIRTLGSVACLWIGLAAGGCASPSFAEGVKQARGWERADLLLEEIGPRLRKGMSQQEVLSIAGYPDNMDDDVLWLWVCDNSPSCHRPMGDWVEVLLDAGGHPGIDVFLFFDSVGNLLGGPYRSFDLNGDPWRTYLWLSNLPMSDVEGLLGTCAAAERARKEHTMRRIQGDAAQKAGDGQEDGEGLD